MDKTFTFDRWKLALYLEVVNAYNFDYSDRTRLTGLPVLPILGIKGEW